MISFKNYQRKRKRKLYGKFEILGEDGLTEFFWDFKFGSPTKLRHVQGGYRYQDFRGKKMICGNDVSRWGGRLLIGDFLYVSKEEQSEVRVWFTDKMAEREFMRDAIMCSKKAWENMPKTDSDLPRNILLTLLPDDDSPRLL